MRRLLLLSGLSFFAATFASAQSIQPAIEHDTIVLSLQLVAGQPATLAVLTADGRIAPGVPVVLSSGELVTTDESGRAHFLAPRDAGVSFARIPGTGIREATDVLPQQHMDAPLQIISVPTLAALNNRFAVNGSGFSGDADRNRVELGDRNALVLASSPLELIVMPPANAVPGSTKLAVFEGMAETTTKLTLVNIESTSAGDTLLRSRKSHLTLRVHGTTEPMRLEIRSLSPSPIEFPDGGIAQVRTSGGSDNVAVVPVNGVSEGPFFFAVHLENTSTTSNLPVARDFLEVAQKIAPRDETKALQRILKNLQGSENSKDIAKAQRELRAIVDHSSPGDFQTLIECARRALAGE